MINKGFLWDDRLSRKAKWLLTYLLSKPDWRKVYLTDLINQGQDGRDSVRTWMQELKNYWYVVAIVNRDEKWKITWHDYEVFENCSLNENAENPKKTNKKTQKNKENPKKQKQKNNNSWLSNSGLSTNGKSNIGKTHTTNKWNINNNDNSNNNISNSVVAKSDNVKTTTLVEKILAKKSQSATSKKTKKISWWAMTVEIDNIIETMKEKLEAKWLQYSNDDFISNNWKKVTERMQLATLLRTTSFVSICEKHWVSPSEFIWQIIEETFCSEFWYWKIYGPKTLKNNRIKVYNDTLSKTMTKPLSSKTAL